MNNGSLPELLNGGYGQLANGPLPLIEKYARVLTSHEVACLVSEPRAPLRLLNDKWIPESGSTKLLKIGDGYVFAESFQAIRLF